VTKIHVLIWIEIKKKRETFFKMKGGRMKKIWDFIERVVGRLNLLQKTPENSSKTKKKIFFL